MQLSNRLQPPFVLERDFVRRLVCLNCGFVFSKALITFCDLLIELGSLRTNCNRCLKLLDRSSVISCVQAQASQNHGPAVVLWRSCGRLCVVIKQTFGQSIARSEIGCFSESFF